MNLRFTCCQDLPKKSVKAVTIHKISALTVDIEHGSCKLLLSQLFLFLKEEKVDDA